MRKITLVVIGILVLFQTRVVAQVHDQQYAKAIEAATASLKILQDTQHIPALSVALVSKGKLVWQDAFGYADLDTRTPVTVDDRFRIGSVSKSFTSVAVARLVEEKKLDLDVPIQTYVPSFPLKTDPITLRQLGGHLSGIRHYTSTDYIHPEHYPSVLSSLVIFQNDSLLFKPGTRYSYSTYAYTLISAAVETAAHSSFTDYMQQAVFKPLGMQMTTADFADSNISHKVTNYEWSQQKQQIVKAAYEDLSYKWAGGGFLSTPTDMVRLGAALLGNKFLKEYARNLLFTTQYLPDGKPTNYGFGWQILKDDKGRTIYCHGGVAQGGRAFLLLYPEQQLVIAVNANMGNARYAQRELGKIAELFMQ